MKVWPLLSAALTLLAAPLFSVQAITLEHAWTTEQINWGLMQRTALAENHGMLFHYGRPTRPTFWAFNCYLDLSIAFIDNSKVITEIKNLDAYPEKMDPSRPVNDLQDMAKYRPEDPIVQFFLQHAVTSSAPIQYVLEMQAGWFEKNDVHVGDRITWDIAAHSAIFHTRR